MIRRSCNRSVYDNISESWKGDWKGAASWIEFRYWSADWSEQWKSWSRSGKTQIVISSWRTPKW